MADLLMPPASASPAASRPSAPLVDGREEEREEPPPSSGSLGAAEGARRKEEVIDKLFHFKAAPRPAHSGARLGELRHLDSLPPRVEPLVLPPAVVAEGEGGGVGAATEAARGLGEIHAEEADAAAREVLEWVVGELEEGEAPPALGMEHFTLLRLVGRGGYGKVFQVRCQLNQQVYAMKVVDKASVERYRSMDNIATELAVLRRYAENRHPFILGLECAFQSPSKLHFVMEYVPGGMLFNHLRKHEIFSEKMARFYAAEVMLGLEHLHEMRIIYRDLKPENVLVCADGNIKLCDFGLAAIGLTASATHVSSSGKAVLVGTTEYMAPEVLRRMECGQAVDIWALGVLIFEMMTGEPPWWHKDQKELQRKIAHTKFKVPHWFTNEAKTLCRGLLTKDPRERLGVAADSPSCMSDIPALKAHPFFRGLSMKMLLLRKLEAPFVPELSGEQPELDVSNFDTKYTLEAPCLSPLRKPLSDGMEQQFDALSLEYMSPETRTSLRISRVTLSSRGSNGSDRSSFSGSVSGSESMLRFLPKRQ